jgi:hypothetical protein
MAQLKSDLACHMDYIFGLFIMLSRTNKVLYLAITQAIFNEHSS